MKYSYHTDNACNLLDYFLSREPIVASKLRFRVDAFHHKGHKRCSSYMAHGSDPVSGFLNSSVNEIKNRLHKHLKHVGDCRAITP